MGKKTKPKRNGDIDNNLEARALRKAAEHKPKQLVDSYGVRFQFVCLFACLFVSLLKVVLFLRFPRVMNNMK